MSRPTRHPDAALDADSRSMRHSTRTWRSIIARSSRRRGRARRRRPDLPRPTRVGLTVALRSAGGAAARAPATARSGAGAPTTTASSATGPPPQRPPHAARGPCRRRRARGRRRPHRAPAGSRVWCWGAAAAGGSPRGRHRRIEALRPGVEASAVARGEAHTCVFVRGRGRWGADDRGRSAASPCWRAAVPLPRLAVAVRAGGSFTKCARSTTRPRGAGAPTTAAAWARRASLRARPRRGGGRRRRHLARPRRRPRLRARVGRHLVLGDRADGQPGDGVGPMHLRAARVDRGFARRSRAAGRSPAGCRRRRRCARAQRPRSARRRHAHPRGEPVTTLGFRAPASPSSRRARATAARRPPTG